VTNVAAPCPAICSPIKREGIDNCNATGRMVAGAVCRFNGLTLPLPEG
jgi:hypothetical protein